MPAEAVAEGEFPERPNSEFRLHKLAKFLVVSHDRWFLDRVATHILAFEGESTACWFNGNYSAYLEDFRRRKGHDADQPHRIKYRKLTR